MIFKDTTVENRFIALVAEQMAVAPVDVTLSTGFTNDLGMDSLDSIELVMAVEHEFGIEVSDDEAVECVSVQQAINLIEKKVAAL